MALQIGIVGLPNVGKSTLFQALTRKQVPAENYPFCTIDPNVGVVAVPDDRLERLAPLVHTTRIVPTAIEFVDIAGLVKDAHKGEGLGNQFLSHIRSVDAIAEVLRVFSHPDVIHVAGAIDPLADKETIQLELVMADLQVVEKLRDNAFKASKSGDKNAQAELILLEKLYITLAAGNLAQTATLDEDEHMYAARWQFLTLKPFVYIANTNEDATINDIPESIRSLRPVCISAKIESELAQLSEEDAKNMLMELGMVESGLTKLVHRGYDILSLMTFFTAGEKEVRAWTIPRGAHAPQAAGVIHSDFEKGFIRAEVVSFNDFTTCGGWLEARTKGKVRIEGKEYVVQDGDIMLFHHAR